MEHSQHSASENDMRMKLKQVARRIARPLPVPVKIKIIRILTLIYWARTGQLSFRIKESRVRKLGIIPDDIYAEWIRRYDTLSLPDKASICEQVTQLTRKPLISVLISLSPGMEERLFFKTLDSLKRQLYSNWELIVVGAEISDEIKTASQIDSRVRTMEYGALVHDAENSAIDLALGEFIAFLNEGDILPEQAFAMLASAMNKRSEADIIYSDGDSVSDEGRRHSPVFETDWNLDLFLGRNILSHLCAYRRELVKQAGGIREGFGGTRHYDLAMRASEATTPAKIHHIPSVLHHARDTDISDTTGEDFENRIRMVEEHFSRMKQAGVAERHPASSDWVRVRRLLPSPAPRVSIIVPTRDKPELIGPCVEGLLNRTDYPSFEVVIVDHESREAETLALFERFSKDSRVKIIRYSGPFNYSAINNAAIAQCESPLICLLNNDIDVISPGWLKEMVAYAILPEVGAVGAKLLYPDDRVQHCGVLLRGDGVGSHFHHFANRDSLGHGGHAVLATTVSAVTGACLLVRKEVFHEVGGLNECDLPVAFNDVDLCLKIKRAGYRNVMVPQAELYHHESASRGSDFTAEKMKRFRGEQAYMSSTWKDVLDKDGFYNLNCSQEFGNFALAFPSKKGCVRF